MKKMSLEDIDFGRSLAPKDGGGYAPVKPFGPIAGRTLGEISVEDLVAAISVASPDNPRGAPASSRIQEIPFADEDEG